MQDIERKIKRQQFIKIVI